MQLSVYRPLLLASVLALATGQPGESQSPAEVATEEQRTHLQTLIAALRNDATYVPGELLVKFKAGSTPEQRTGALRVLRSSVTPESSDWIGDTLHVRGLVDEDPERAAVILARQPEIAFAEPNYISHLRSVPNDPGFPSQWHMELINMPTAWEINSSAGEGVVVAVLDSGLTTIDGTFNFRVWTGFGFSTFPIPFARAADFDHSHVRSGAEFTPFVPVWRSPSGQPILFDAVGHGTHVAGTIAQQTDNANGYAGIANGATILPVKVCFGPWDVQLGANALGIAGFATEEDEGCTHADIARGIRYAVDSGAKVLNLSVGSESPSEVVRDALLYAVQRGVFVSIAAGNAALEGNATDYPAAYAPSLNGVVAVGAVTREARRAAYSNYGSYVEISAPGGAAFAGPADDIWQVVPNEDDLDLLRLAPAFSRYMAGFMAGTSMAAPHVAGLAALLYSQGVTNPAAIEAALKRFARDLGPPGRDDEYGSGLIDAKATLLGLGVLR